MEAVNTSITNAQFARPDVAAARRGVAVADAGAQVASNAGDSTPGGADVPFTRLNITVNSRFDEAILEIRDSRTGDIEQEIPSTEELETQQRLQRASETEEAISQISLRDNGQRTQRGQNNDGQGDQSVTVRPGNSNESAQVQLNQSSTDSEATSGTDQNADNGVTGQAIAALQAASNSTANTGGTGNGDQSAQVSVLA